VGVSELPGFEGLIDVNANEGGVRSYITELSVEVDAALFVPKVSSTEFAATEGITVPAPVMAVADNVHVMLSTVDMDQVMPLAVPFCTISDVVKLLDPTGLENITRKLMGNEFTGSA
jgi:hypothetical protein